VVVGAVVTTESVQPDGREPVNVGVTGVTVAAVVKAAAVVEQAYLITPAVGPNVAVTPVQVVVNEAAGVVVGKL
jgi:hypothetical protein